MCSLLYDIPVFHDQNQIRIPYSGKPVGYDKAGPSLHQIVHCFLNPGLCPCIHGTGCLIQNQYPVVRKDGACNGQQLTLSLGYIAGIFIQFHLIPARQCLDKPVCMGCFCRLHHFLVRGIQSAVTDIFHNCPLEKPCILQHHAKALPQFASVELPYIVPVHLNLTAVHIIEAHQQFHYSGFSGSGRPYDRHHLPRLYLTAEIMDNQLIRLISEFHMLKTDAALYLFRPGRMFHANVLFLFPQEFKDPLRGSRHGLQHIGYLRHLCYGLGKVLYILDKSLNVTDLYRPSDCQQASAYRHRHISQIAYKHHDRLHHP